MALPPDLQSVNNADMRGRATLSALAGHHRRSAYAVTLLFDGAPLNSPARPRERRVAAYGWLSYVHTAVVRKGMRFVFDKPDPKSRQSRTCIRHIHRRPAWRAAGDLADTAHRTLRMGVTGPGHDGKH